MKIKLIANPVASRAAPERIEAIRAQLLLAGCEPDVTVTSARGDAEQAAALAGAKGFDRILVAGGDGTLNEAINGLVPSPIPVGFIPLGTTNVLALELGIPPAVSEALESFLHGIPRRVYTGLAANRRFLLMAGVGFDAEAVHGVDPGLKRRFGKLAYLWSALRILARGPSRPMQLTIDGQEIISGAGVILCNGRKYGGRFVLAPEASIEEPALDVCLFLELKRRHLPGLLAQAAAGKGIRSEAVRHFKARQVAVTGDTAVQLDGDSAGRLPMTFSSSPDELWLVMPTDRP
ncbi:MAG: diacylglycerol kinase family lipid kinase [Deltaproteobacteria bacterium]|nr:diacylglycerol kinase family lipid kinase [Deltaproteobacteria bacterium]